MKSSPNNHLTFGGHLEVLRKLLFRVLGVTVCVSIAIFCFKQKTFDLLLAPSEWDFISYRWMERIIKFYNPNFVFDEYHVDLIATELSSQFMTHISTAIYLGMLCASPYILYELFRFVAPALYDNERKYSIPIIISIYFLFILGILLSYFVIYPLSFRFLGTYSVDYRVHSTITLDSYINTFITLSLGLGVVFQLPALSLMAAKLELITSESLKRYRKYALLIIMLSAAIITPPDVMTLLLVSLPMYLLYELSILIVIRFDKTERFSQ